MKKLSLSIDFDNTIVIDAYPEVGDPIEGAIETIQKLAADGHSIIINTCRTGPEGDSAKEYLKKNNVPYDTFNENLPEAIAQYEHPARKICADIYIDDRNLGGIPPWNVIYEMITKQALNK